MIELTAGTQGFTSRWDFNLISEVTPQVFQAVFPGGPGAPALEQSGLALCDLGRSPPWVLVFLPLWT